MNPPQQVVFAFLTVITIGSLLLMLPISSTGESARPIDTIFVATSAMTVTGLSPVDTHIAWSGFGQLVILVLIQLGGLGVMTFASIIGIALTRRMGLQARMVAAAESRTIDFDDARTVLTSIVRLVVVCEATVAVLLYLALVCVHRLDPIGSIWDAVFHAVSAFNNAGFSTFEGNLVRFVDSPWVCIPVALAIITGGLGFPVIAQILKFGPKWNRLSLTAKMVLTATPALLLLGTLSFLVFEWRNPATIGQYDFGTRILASFFQSVQTRTAGFNTLEFGQMESETLLFTDLLQFIGGGPAGTAGGIKLTVFMVIAATIVAVIRGEGAVQIFGKRIHDQVVRRAAAIGVVAVGLCAAVSMLLLATTEFTLDQILLEVTSAWGTVGLSTGITTDLPDIAKIAITALMFIGRLGPLTIAAAMVPAVRPLPYELPEERPIIA